MSLSHLIQYCRSLPTEFTDCEDGEYPLSDFVEDAQKELNELRALAGVCDVIDENLDVRKFKIIAKKKDLGEVVEDCKYAIIPHFNITQNLFDRLYPSLEPHYYEVEVRVNRIDREKFEEKDAAAPEEGTES